MLAFNGRPECRLERVILFAKRKASIARFGMPALLADQKTNHANLVV
jgi:hypothetical protein